MSESVIPARITATPAAREAIGRLRAARGGPVMFVQSGGCCAGSTPMCFPEGELIIGDVDLLLGDIDGCPFYIDKRLDEAWNQDEFLLDVAEGEPEDFSLAAGENQHFVTLSPTRAKATGPSPVVRGGTRHVACFAASKTESRVCRSTQPSAVRGILAKGSAKARPVERPGVTSRSPARRLTRSTRRPAA